MLNLSKWLCCTIFIIIINSNTLVDTPHMAFCIFICSTTKKNYQDTRLTGYSMSVSIVFHLLWLFLSHFFFFFFLYLIFILINIYDTNIYSNKINDFTVQKVGVNLLVIGILLYRIFSNAEWMKLINWEEKKVWW